MTATKTMSPAVAAAAASDALWELGVVEAMRHFRIGHADLKRAKEHALSVRPKAVAAAMARAAVADQFDRCVRIELLHPGIHRRLAADSESAASVGRVYGLTRARAGQVLRELSELAQRRSWVSLDRAAQAVEDEARTRHASAN